MNKKTLRRLSILLCLALVLAMLPVTAMAADTQFIYFNDGGASLWGQGGAWYAAWVWGDGVEGQWATATYSEGEGIYFFEVPAAATSIKFLRMASGATEPTWTQGDSGWWNQTDDLTIDGDYYTITGWGGTDGKWSIFGDVTPEETTQATEPENTEPAEPTYIVAGSSTAVFGTSWDPANTANKMTLVDGIYTITYTGVTASFTFKVTDGTWSNSWPGSDYSVEITAESSVTITYNPSDNAVNAVVEVTGEELEPVVYDYYVAGSAGLCGTEWNPGDAANKMTLNEAGTMYVKEYTGVAAGDYQLKVTTGSWETPSYGDDSTDSKNYEITVYEDGSTVSVYFMPSSSYVLIDVQAPAVEEDSSALALGDNVDCGLGSYTFTATQAGVLTVNVTALSYYDEYSGEWGTVNPNMAFGMQYTLLVNGITNYTPTNSVNVKVGDVVTIELQSRMGAETKATINLSIEDYKVKYQVTQGADATAESVNVRFLTSVDSLDYQSVKFTFTVGDQSSEQVCTTVYESLLADGVTIDDASTVFGEGAKYFVAFTVTGVSDYETPIEVTVTWTALDGTETTATRTIVIADALA